tara:strand:- start:152 stop:430 length:279 start_codon:yes stop_codon:yes gene_type:complete
MRLKLKGNSQDKYFRLARAKAGGFAKYDQSKRPRKERILEQWALYYAQHPEVDMRAVHGSLALRDWEKLQHSLKILRAKEFAPKPRATQHHV